MFTNEELIGEKYERLKEYLRNELNIRESDIDTDVEIVIQAANRLLSRNRKYKLARAR